MPNSKKNNNHSENLKIEGDPILETCMGILRGLMAYHYYEVKGIENIPTTGAGIIAFNHSLASYDSMLLGVEILLKTGRYPIGLVDRRIAQTPGLSHLFKRMGTLPGSPAIAEEMLRKGRLIILSPGGMRESLRPSSQRYRINWEERLGFVRLAIKTGAPVILAACPAADDIFTVYKNPITDFLYREWKLPLPIARGYGLSLVPRRVKLIHYIRPPIFPPNIVGAEHNEKVVRGFHTDLIKEMKVLMEKPASLDP